MSLEHCESPCSQRVAGSSPRAFRLWLRSVVTFGEILLLLALLPDTGAAAMSVVDSVEWLTEASAHIGTAVVVEQKRHELVGGRIRDELKLRLERTLKGAPQQWTQWTRIEYPPTNAVEPRLGELVLVFWTMQGAVEQAYFLEAESYPRRHRQAAFTDDFSVLRDGREILRRVEARVSLPSSRRLDPPSWEHVPAKLLGPNGPPGQLILRVPTSAEAFLHRPSFGTLYISVPADPKYRRVIGEVLSDPRRSDNSAAATLALSHYGDSAAKALLRELLDDPTKRYLEDLSGGTYEFYPIREAAWVALARLGEVHALPERPPGIGDSIFIMFDSFLSLPSR